MTINTDLLVAAPMLQDYLVDKDTGLPLTNGIISLYKDTARSFYKNWYYQTGAPGAYAWVALDNPLNLSSAGTIQDPNGNDVIPFYYPYQEDNENAREAYYITVYSSDESGNPTVLQFTRENFPFLPSNLAPIASNPTWRNYILNNVYWRNIGSLDAMTVLDQIIAPSQHDGYTNGDIRFIKNTAGANDDLLFAPMTATLENDITPETMLNMICSGTTPGETSKCIQYPISLHIKTLNSVTGTIIFHGQNVAGNPNNYVDLYFYQYLGTGALSQPDPILIQRVVLQNTFTRTLVPFTTPSAAGLVLGNGGDDALFLRVQYPLSATFNINHTKPQIYLSTDVPDNDFDTYDQCEVITSSPRTGDYRTSINAFTPYGWVPCNDGSIGSSASGASTRANIDTWPLYNLLWTSINDAFCPVATGRGVSAYADFSANKAMTLTQSAGFVMAGIPPTVTFTYDHTTALLTMASAGLFYIGSPLQVANTGGALPSAFTAGTIYYAIPISATTIKLASTYANALAGTAVAAGATDGTGTQSAAFAVGGLFGEPRHTMTLAELVTHHHTVPFSITPNVLSSGGGHNQVDAGPTNTSDTGSSTPFNVVQPTIYVNVFLKL